VDISFEENRIWIWVHPTKAYFASCTAMILILKKSTSLNPYACFWSVLILLISQRFRHVAIEVFHPVCEPLEE